MKKIMTMIDDKAKRRFALVIDLFSNTNVSTSTASGNDLSALGKEFYSKYIIDLAEPELVHDRFADKYPIPKGNGKTITFHQFTPLVKMLEPLTEGVTPEGQKLNVSELRATVAQYGGYVETSDVLDLTSTDPIVVQATEMIGSQAGRTLDTVSREVLSGGTNVMYQAKGDGTAVTSRTAIDSTCIVNAKTFKRAAMLLKRQNAPTINGSYVALIHPDVAYDLMNDEGWIDAHKYMDATKIFDGELGKIGSVRFVESTEAKIFSKAGANSINVYATIVLGAHAYATTEITGGGLVHIVKPLGSAGSADPLNQRATVGWKATKVTERLVEQYMVRIESASSEGATAIIT